MSSGVKRKPKRGRYAEFYSAPRTSSPIQSETPNRRSSRGSVLVLSPPPTGEKKTLNSTITINSSAENSRKNSLAKLDRSEEEKEILKYNFLRWKNCEENIYFDENLNLETKNHKKVRKCRNLCDLFKAHTSSSFNVQHFQVHLVWVIWIKHCESSLTFIISHVVKF